jgi:hypothetical protein
MTKSNSENSQMRLGQVGEIIVMNHFSKKGSVVEASINPYDRQKDMIIDDKKIEVKTQVPFVNKNAFTIRENQLKKCLEVDELFFISVPNKQKEHHSSGKVYIANPKTLQYKNYQTRDGRKMILIPIEQESVKEVFTMSEEECMMLQKYSISGWN